jgi:hypothetical protein
LLNCVSAASQPPISFDEHLGRLGMSALWKVQARKIQPERTVEPSTGQRGFLSRALSWLNGGFTAPKQLRVLETVALGEKRLVAVIQADGRRFLVGGGPSGVSLLTPLDHAQKSVNGFESTARLTELAG